MHYVRYVSKLCLFQNSCFLLNYGTHFTLFLYFSSKTNVNGRPTTLFNSNNTKTYVTLQKYDGWVHIAKWYSARPHVFVGS